MDVLATASLSRQEQPGGLEEPVQPVPYIFIAPEDPSAIGEIARRVYREHYRRPWNAGARDLWLLGKILDGGADAMHGELLSYVFFAGEFAEKLIQLGQADAQRWIDEHPGGPLAARPTTRLDPGEQQRTHPQLTREGKIGAGRDRQLATESVRAPRDGVFCGSPTLSAALRISSPGRAGVCCEFRLARERHRLELSVCLPPVIEPSCKHNLCRFVSKAVVTGLAPGSDDRLPPTQRTVGLASIKRSDDCSIAAVPSTRGQPSVRLVRPRGVLWFSGVDFTVLPPTS